jgi:hypothetical protein
VQAPRARTTAAAAAVAAASAAAAAVVVGPTAAAAVAGVATVGHCAWSCLFFHFPGALCRVWPAAGACALPWVPGLGTILEIHGGWPRRSTAWQAAAGMVEGAMAAAETMVRLSCRTVCRHSSRVARPALPRDTLIQGCGACTLWLEQFEPRCAGRWHFRGRGEQSLGERRPNAEAPAKA